MQRRGVASSAMDAAQRDSLEARAGKGAGLESAHNDHAL